MRLTFGHIQKLISKPEFGPFVLFVVEIIAFAILSDSFLSRGNISNLLAFTPELGMIALAMTILMTSGEFDLSVGSVFGLTPIIMWTFYNAEISSQLGCKGATMNYPRSRTCLRWSKNKTADKHERFRRRGGCVHRHFPMPDPRCVFGFKLPERWYFLMVPDPCRSPLQMVFSL